jgi:hypothetical protein
VTAGTLFSSHRNGASAARVSLVTEAYNLAEGQSEAAFVRALEAVNWIAAHEPQVEAIVLDPTPGKIAAPILADRFPQLRALHVPGLSYDGQKNAAAIAARGEFLVYLDGDCVPQGPDWLTQILSPFAQPQVHAVAGLTLYEGGDVTSKAMSVLDWGFLFEPNDNGDLGCYSSNNVAFRRQTRLTHIAPDEGILRCYCYKHAQLLMRAGMPVRAHHEAFVLHELPDIETERLRRGYDYAAVLWSDPALSDAADVALDDDFIERIVADNARLAIRRLEKAPRALGIGPGEADDVIAEINRLMVIDRQGFIDALAHGERQGLNAQTRAAHRLTAQTLQKRTITNTLTRQAGD